MPPSSILTPDFQELVQWDAGTEASPLEVGKARLKEFRTLGHKIERFLAARSACLAHAAKADVGIPCAWGLQSHPPKGEWESEGLFACAVRVADMGMHLPQPILPAEMASRLAALWQRVDPDAPKPLPPALAIPEDANDAMWLALLRLRPLRGLWERELRRATLEGLMDVLPDAWVLDPAPLPPGAVIPRLELAAWEELGRLSSSGRRFVIAPARGVSGGAVLDDTVAAEEWRAAIQSALDDFATGPRVLVESAIGGPASQRPAAGWPAAGWLIGFFQRRAGRVDALGYMGLSLDEDGRLVPGQVAAA